MSLKKLPIINELDLSEYGTEKLQIYRFRIDETDKEEEEENSSNKISNKNKYGPFKKVNSNIIFSSKPILLKCQANNNFVSRNNSNEIVANKEKIAGVSEFFEFKYLSGGLIALMSKVRNDFISAENAGKQCLMSNRAKIIGSWEVFELYDNSDQTISLKSLSNGNFISANNNECKLIANKISKGPWEKFYIINLLNF